MHIFHYKQKPWVKQKQQCKLTELVDASETCSSSILIKCYWALHAQSVSQVQSTILRSNTAPRMQTISLTDTPAKSVSTKCLAMTLDRLLASK